MFQLVESNPGLTGRLAEMLKGNLGFALLALGVFSLAFAGISFASRGLPGVPGSTPAHVAAVRPDPVVASIEPNVRASERKGWSFGAPQDDKGAGRNLMRLTAIQAANAYTQSPCDRAAKAAFIVATSTYIKSYAADDARVRDAMQAAFAKGGVSKDEFPSDTQAWLKPITPASDDADAACAAGRRADAAR